MYTALDNNKSFDTNPMHYNLSYNVYYPNYVTKEMTTKTKMSFKLGYFCILNNKELLITLLQFKFKNLSFLMFMVDSPNCSILYENII